MLACGLDSLGISEYVDFTPKGKVVQVPLYHWDDIDKTLLIFRPFPINK